jgi:sugar lactone lactonase YvrE
MKWLALLLGLLLAGCSKLDREAVVLLFDEQYRAEILLGNGDGIDSPDGLLWRDGHLYIADEGGSAVRVWAQGRPVRTLADSADGLSSPEDLAIAGDGSLLASDDDRGGVWRIAADGAATRLALLASSSEGLALAPSGQILIGDPPRRRILALAANGHVSRLTGQDIAKAESFAFDAAGNLYIGDNRDQRLYWLGPDGRLHRPISERSGFSPESLHFAGGALFITDSDHGKLYRYTPEDGLTTIALFAGSLANVQGITSDPAGNLYVSVQSDLRRGRGYIVRLARRRAD